MRRKLAFAVGVATAVLVTAGVAAAANGGFTPLTPHSPNAQNTRTSYWVILGFTAAIFLIVEVTLAVFIWRYRAGKRPRTADGDQVHGHTRLEIIWTVVPVLILAVIATVVFIELPGIANAPAAANPIRITVEGHQFYWQFDYPNGARSINDMHVPVGEVVDLTVRSYDVVHSWWIPQLAGKIQAIPGRTNHTWFRADQIGTYYGQCAEFCGIFHALMKASVVVTDQTDYERYISKTATADLGRAEFEGVCATCHGMQGQGGYGPTLSNNPLITQPAAVDEIIRNGRGNMPPVGDSWTDQQVNALVTFMKTHIYKGAGTSGG